MIHDLSTAQFVIFVLVILLILAVFIIIKLSKNGRSSKQDWNDNHDFVSKEAHKKMIKERDYYYSLYDGLRKKDDAYTDDEFSNGTILLQEENGRLKQKIEELTRKNNELNRLLDSDSNSVDVSKQAEVNLSYQMSKQVDDVTSKINDKYVTRYASFPRSAGSSIYFSDLSDKLADDSYFELRISNETGIASFRPLDFMKIRNYDPAMAAIQTDGVKPNVASSVVGIEAGQARLEGNDWIINEPAKVKLV